VGPDESQQLKLEIVRPARPQRPAPHPSRSSPVAGPRLALSPDEAAALLGVSRDYLDEHVIHELRTVRRGRRILIALAEIEQWLDHAATRTSLDHRAGKAFGA
jgi:excisionase family DNA binding protein